MQTGHCSDETGEVVAMCLVESAIADGDWAVAQMGEQHMER
jgi:hypothetical protein